MKWPFIIFEDLYLEPSRNGVYKASEFTGYGTPYVKMSQQFSLQRIFPSWVIFDLIDLTQNEIGQLRLKSGDLLFSRTSVVPEGVGKCSIVLEVNDDICFDSNIIRVRVNPKKCSPYFLFYYFLSPIGRNQILSLANGAAIKTIKGSDLKKLRILFPPLNAQERIASILSAYDDLIENNNRRIALLEESMRLLYREWFVRLRFPGHEHVRMVGGLPEGWREKSINQAFEILGGGTPSKGEGSYWQDGEINWYTPTDLTKSKSMFAEESSSKINKTGLQNSSAKLFPPYSIMMTSRATIGEIAINTTTASTNQGFITCVPNEQVPLYFLYQWLKEHVDIFIGHATGATFKEITKGVFKQLPIILPDKNILKMYEDIVNPMAEAILNLQRQNARLKEARDLLLPRLMSGEITVT